MGDHLAPSEVEENRERGLVLIDRGGEK